MTTWIIENMPWVGIGFVAVFVAIKVAVFKVLARMTRNHHDGNAKP